MQLRSDIQLASAIRSLTDVIAPAIDPSESLAQEQVRIVIGLLELLAQRLPLQFQFDCDELARLHALTRSLATQARSALDAEAATEFTAAQADAADVLDRAKAGPEEVLAAVRRLRVVCADATAAIHAAAPQERSNLKDIILGHSAEQLLRDRVWLISQGWEKKPENLPEIGELIG
jgi:hypothetical protein